jgi:hypothetical protein
MEYCFFLRAAWLAAGLYAYLAFPGMVQRQSAFWNGVFNNDPPAQAVCLNTLIVPLDTSVPPASETSPEYPGSLVTSGEEPKVVTPPLEYFPLTVPLVMNQSLVVPENTDSR